MVMGTDLTRWPGSDLYLVVWKLRREADQQLAGGQGLTTNKYHYIISIFLLFASIATQTSE